MSEDRKTTNKPKKNRDPIEDFKFNVKLDVGEAERDLKELEKKVKKVHSIADAGRHRQKGFLSKEQVNLYKDLLAEMEEIYSSHYNKLESIESTQAEKLKSLEKEIIEREKLLNQAMGGNRWGDMASKGVRDFHTRKLEENYKEKEALSDDTVDELIGALKLAVDRLGEGKDSTIRSSERIEDMNVRSLDTDRIIDGITGTLASAGVLMSSYQFMNHMQKSAGKLADQEYDAASIGMKSTWFDGSDVSVRDLATDTGLDNQYKGDETLQTQARLLSGGSYSDRFSMADDTRQAQIFGRAHATDPNEIAESFSSVRKLGAMDEGEMSRFAGLIAQAIKQGGMQGREEEFYRTNTSLLKTMSSQIVTLGEDRLAGIIKLQSDIGESTPELRGERGGDMLDRMDSAIKGGGASLDILLGKGIEQKGLEGADAIRRMKAEGLSNPETLQTILKNIDERMHGSSLAKEMIIQDNLNITPQEYDALSNSGILDRVREGDYSVSEEEKKKLIDEGHTSLTEKIEMWGETDTERRLGNEAKAEERDTKAVRPASKLIQWGTEQFQKLPNALQLGVKGGLAFGSGALIKKGGQKLAPYLSKIGGEKVSDFIAGGSSTGFGAKLGGFATTAKNIGSSGAQKLSESMGKTTFTAGIRDGVTKHGGKLLGMVDDGWGSMMTGLANQGTKLASIGGDSLLKRGLRATGKGLTKAGEGAAKMGSKVPVVGSLIGTATDRVFNPEHNWGRSIARGVGSGLGTAAGVLATGALALPTGGTSLAAGGALTIGGGVAGEQLGDSIYSFFAGKDDKVRQKETDAYKKEQKALKRQQKKEKKALEKEEGRLEPSMEPLSVAPSTKPTQSTLDPLSKGEQKVTSMEVRTLNIENRSLAEVMKSQRGTVGSGGGGGRYPGDLETMLRETPKEHILTIDIRGNITGVTPESEKEVTDSLKGLFSGLFGSSTHEFNLASDQIRR